MKKTTLLLAGLFLYILASGQNYIPLLQENRSWNVLSVVLPYPNPWDSTYNTYTYKIMGETGIDTLEYKNVYWSDEQYPSNWGLYALVREDDDKRVWVRDVDGEEEFLLYDFSASAGDSLMIGWYNDFIYIHVDSITQVEIDGVTRDKFWLSQPNNDWYSETWIEGIGSSCGMLWSGSRFTIVGGKYIFLCMSQDDELIYMNPAYNACYMTSTGVHEQRAARPHIYPNPASGTINLEKFSTPEIHSIELLDLSGKLIRSFTPDDKILDVNAIRPGLYLLKIHHEKGLFSQKILIE